MTNNKLHDEHTRLISLKPQLIGLDGIVLSTAEANIRNSKGSIIRQPDNLLFKPSTHTIYNIEYKCNDTKSGFNHAKIQLTSSKDILKFLFTGWNITNLYITEDYKVNVVR